MKIGIIGNGFDIEHGLWITFNEFVSSDEFKREVKSFGKFFNDDKYKEFCSNSELWSKFEEYISFILQEGKIKQYNVFLNNINRAFSSWMDGKNLSTLKKEGVDNFKDLLECNFIISLNYTKTIEHYGFKPKWFEHDSFSKEWDVTGLNGYYVNIHWFKSKSKGSHYILGNDSNEKITKNKLIENWEQGHRFNPKKMLFNSIRDKKTEITEIYIYGVSLGESDQDLVNLIKSLKNVKITIIGKEKPPFGGRNVRFKEIV